MIQRILIPILFLLPISAMAQVVEIETPIKITSLSLHNSADSVVVVLSDGTLARRDASTLSPDMDNQVISISNDTIFLSDGGFVKLPAEADNLGHHMATQNIQLKGHFLSSDGSNKGISIDSTGRVGIMGDAIPMRVNILDFETPSAATQFQYFGGSLEGQDGQIIDNLSIAGINTSAQVYEFIKAGDAPPWAGAFSTPDPPTSMDLTTGKERICIKVWKPTVGNVAIKLTESTNGGSDWVQTVSNTDMNQWIQLCYDVTLPSEEAPFLPAAHFDYTRLIIFMDFGMPGSGSDVTHYFDDVEILPPAVTPVMLEVVGAAKLQADTDNSIEQVVVIGPDGILAKRDIAGISDADPDPTNEIQTISRSGHTVTLSSAGGSFIDSVDNMGNHTALQNINLGTHWLSHDGSASGLNINSGNVGIGTATPLASLDVVGEILVSKPMPDSSDIIVGVSEIKLHNTGHVHWSIINNPSNGHLHISNTSALYPLGTPGDSAIVITQSNNIGIGRTPSTNKLEVEGNASKSSAGDWLANSDARLKKNIRSLNAKETLNQLLQLQGVTYEWDDQQTGSKRPEGLHYGFTAQNVQSVFPSLVEEDNQGFLQTSYGTYDAMYVEAIRALEDRITNQNIEIRRLETQLDDYKNLEARINDLESIMRSTDNEYLYRY